MQVRMKVGEMTVEKYYIQCGLHMNVNVLYFIIIFILSLYFKI